MANASHKSVQIAQQTRPRMPHRTLSSSLRVYSSPLLPRSARRSKTAPVNGGLATTNEASESDPLLGFSPRAKNDSIPSLPTTSFVGTEFTNVDDDDDIEAEQHDEQADSDGLYPPNCCWTMDAKQPPKRSDPYGNRDRDVYGNIHRIRRVIIQNIDDPYSLDQLKAPRMNISVVRPLVDKFYDSQDLSIIYCLLVNRAQFIREQSYAAHHQTVNLTRALLCELLAEKVLRRYNEDNPGPRGLLKLANILVAGFEPFQGASEEVIYESTHAAYRSNRKNPGKLHHQLTALEVAIVSESKSFLASTACQKVVDAIYRGKIVYSPSSFVDILPDHYKKRPISLYDPRRAPVLNQYRLVVPRTRNVIEVVQFIVLLVLYILVMTGRETRATTTYTVVEAVFEVYAFGWILDQVASILEHGWQVYTQNLWSFLDVTFSLLFVVYFGLRMRGLQVDGNDESDVWAIAALDVLSCAAPVLIPRLAFNVMSENMLFLSLRAMMGDFITLTALAIWCFAGFLLSLKWLRGGLHEAATISKWMIFVWFGLDGTGIDQAHTFHPYLGPVLMVTFAFLGNTLFLTILVSMLSNTFSMISSNAIQEIQYRRAVLTFLGVKSDSLFAFMPPFNLAALIFFAPLKFILTPRKFHSVNVFMVRVVNLPFLTLLSWYERNTLWISNQYRHIQPKRIDWKHHAGPRVVAADWWSQTLQLWDFSKFSAHGDIQAVFESDPPEETFHDDHDGEDHEQDHLPEQDRNMPTDDFNDLGPFSPLRPTPTRTKRTQFHMPFVASSPVLLTPTQESEAEHSPASPPTTTPSTPNPNTTTNTTTKPKSKHNHKHKHHHHHHPRRRPRLDSTTDTALRAEFHDSEDEQEAMNRRKSRADVLVRGRGGGGIGGASSGAYARKIRRVERKDSMIDFEDGAGAAAAVEEANVRLKVVEGRLARIEGLLVRVLDGDGDGDGDSIVGGGGDGVGGERDGASETESDAEVETAVRWDVMKERDGHLP